MWRPLVPFAVVVLFAAPSFAQPQHTWYAYGTFCSTCQTASGLNQFYDDGLHDDGAAGDGILGAIVTVDKPAGRYSWCPAADLYGVGILSCGYPLCWCDPNPAPANLWTSGPGDVIHFRLGLATDPSWGGQWLSAGSHGIPPGTHLAVDGGPAMSAYPYAGTGYPAQLNGAYWERVVTIPTPGTYPMRFQTLEGDGLNGLAACYYSDTYNARCCFLSDPERYVLFTTTRPNTDVLFQFDVTNGRMRGVELGPTPTRTRSWGAIKTIYH